MPCSSDCCRVLPGRAGFTGAPHESWPDPLCARSGSPPPKSPLRDPLRARWLRSGELSSILGKLVESGQHRGQGPYVLLPPGTEQRVEAFPAGDADGVQPTLSFAGEYEQVSAAVTGVHPAFDEAQLLQHLQLAADGGLADAEILGQVARARRSDVMQGDEQSVGPGFEVGMHFAHHRDGYGPRAPQEDAELVLDG